VRPQKDDPGTPSTFIHLTLALGQLLHEGGDPNQLPYRMSFTVHGDGDGPVGGIPLVWLSRRGEGQPSLVGHLPVVWLLLHVT
jgi:hypothetical protein